MCVITQKKGFNWAIVIFIIGLHRPHFDKEMLKKMWCCIHISCKTRQLNLAFVSIAYEPRTGSSLGCAPGCDAGGREFETPTGPTLRVLK